MIIQAAEKRGWRDHLPPAVHRFLGRRKAWLCSVVFHGLYPLFSRFPIQDNKIVFDNYRGRGFGCNPKYVAQKLLERDGGDQYDLVWLVDRNCAGNSGLPDRVRTVRYGSPRAFFEYATAKVWVSNYPKMFLVKNGVKKRPGQSFIQTCHGSLGIKKIDGDVPAFTRDRRWLKAAVASSEMTDWWISNSDFETGVYKSAFWGVTDEKILLYGHPRNDIFFDRAMMDRARERIDRTYGTAGKKILLYAPTFREKTEENPRTADCPERAYEIDHRGLLAHLQSRFGGEWMFFVRLHPRTSDVGEVLADPGAGVVDVTGYMDMQELLAAADCLVTDYSSCAFDFLLTGRPVFLFTPDIHEYDTERGFYYPLETTPFPLAVSNEALAENVDAFDEAAYRAKAEAFLRDKGCMEDGRASERVADLIEGICGAQNEGSYV